MLNAKTLDDDFDLARDQLEAACRNTRQIVLGPISIRRTKCRNVRAFHATAAPAKVDDPDTRAANADALPLVCSLQRLSRWPACLRRLSFPPR